MTPFLLRYPRNQFKFDNSQNGGVISLVENQGIEKPLDQQRFTLKKGSLDDDDKNRPASDILGYDPIKMELL